MTDSNDDTRRATHIAEMIAAAEDFYRFGWLFATSGNMSVRSDEKTVAITAANRHLSGITVEDFVDVDFDGKAAKKSAPEPSHDVDIHLAIYRNVIDAGAIYHLHHMEAALCSDRDHKRGFTHLHEVQMIHALGIEGDKPSADIPILENATGDGELAKSIADFLGEDDATDVPCVNIKRHGIYVWGEDPATVRRNAEALAYLFEYSWHRPMHPKKSSNVPGFGL